jgi:hypothetical protein
VAAGWNELSVWWHGVGGKPIDTADSSGTTTIENLTAADAALGGIDQAVIALGTNNVSQTDQQIIDGVNAVLDHAASLDVGEVIWRGIAYRAPTNANAARVNPLIRDTVEAHSMNARFADWAAYVHNGRDETDLWDPSDGSHMTEAGYAVWDEFGILAVEGTTPVAVPYVIQYDGTNDPVVLGLIEYDGAIVPLTLTSV